MCTKLLFACAIRLPMNASNWIKIDISRRYWFIVYMNEQECLRAYVRSEVCVCVHAVLILTPNTICSRFFCEYSLKRSVSSYSISTPTDDRYFLTCWKCSFSLCFARTLMLQNVRFCKRVGRFWLVSFCHFRFHVIAVQLSSNGLLSRILAFFGRVHFVCYAHHILLIVFK